MRSVIVAAAAGLLLAACTAAPPPPQPASTPVPSNPPPVTSSVTEEEVLAIVEEIDMTSRLVTLRRPDGSRVQIYAPPDVRNLQQVRIGDEVVVTYVAELSALRVGSADSPAGAPTEILDQGVMRTPEGAMPGMAVGSSLTTTVTIDSYDPATHIVTFTAPDGVQEQAEIQDPAMQARAARLQPGDQVQVTLSEVSALTVRHPAR
ncbi:hypothetical protein [Geminicoccus flavidas]|uniref:hypothetical protein n=1 Tax=Geminicoccus flavidas TaxID=2506407 RepID=UPI00135783DC|nr:hypothetical protein [Geminicoccus flavidas]